MARRIVDAGFPTTLWARRPSFARALRRHRGVGRGDPGRARRRVGRPRRLRRRRRRRRRGAARPRRRPRRDGRRLGRHRPQHRAPGDLRAAAGGLPEPPRRSTRRSAAAATRRPPASCWSWSAARPRWSTGAGRCSRPSATPCSTSAPSAPARRPRCSTTRCSPRSWPWPPRSSPSPRTADLDQQAVATILASGSGRSYAAEVVAGGGFDLEALAPFAGELLAKDVGILVDRAGLDDTVLLAAADRALERMGVARRPVTRAPPPCQASQPSTPAPSQRAPAGARRRAPLRHARHRRRVAPPDRRRGGFEQQLGGPLPLRLEARPHRRDLPAPPAADHQRTPAAGRPLRPRRPALPLRGPLPPGPHHGRGHRQPLRVLRRADPAHGPSPPQATCSTCRTEGVRSNEEFRRDLHRLLAHLDEPIRQLRIDEGQLLCLHAAADRERAVVSGADVVPFELFANSLFDGMAGFLAAPASEATLRRVRDAGDLGAGRLRVL